MIAITRADLQRYAPRPSGARGIVWDQYADALEQHGGELMADAGIDEPLELQHVMAQFAHECGGFTILWESGAYSAEQIMRIFGVGRHSAAVTQDEARRIAALQPAQRGEVLFDRVYGLGNPRKARELGNREKGDGWRYRGFGIIQTTGRTDHEKLIRGDYSAASSLRAALAEWETKNCNELARRDDLKAITKRINGGYNGLKDRRAWLAKAKRVWPALPADGRPPVTSMMESTTARAAEGVGVGGASAAAIEVSTAVGKAAADDGGVTVGSVLLALAQSPTFWIGVFTVSAAAYIWLERRRKLIVHGV